MPLVTRHLAFRIAAIVGFLGVSLGAFGAHGLKEVLERTGRAANWETATLYHLVHAAVLLMVSRIDPLPRAAWWMFLSGIAVFSGTLYLLAATGITWLGAITPLGGFALLGGWLALALRKE